MKGLTDEEEEALGLAFMNRGDDLQTYAGKAAKAFIQLADAGMIDAEHGSMSGNLVLVRKVLPEGRRHLELVRESLLAAGVESLSADTERVLRNLAWEETCARAAGRGFSHTANEGLLEAYKELSRKKMIGVAWADNTAYCIHGVTDAGWKYVRALVPAKEGLVEIINNPQFTQQVIGSANASSSALASANVTISDAYRAIRDSDATDEQKRAAEDGIGEMERAAAQGDLAAFAAGMEKVASVAKSVGAIASVVVPLVAKLVGGM